jgi:tRNA A-37 threonylcarbamoyl transferase component Bud32
VTLSLDPRIGTELLDYRVESMIGRGGMSAVYLAEDVPLRRRVALKLLAPALAEDAAFRERFLEESQLAASLDHPNVVPIYEAGQADDELYIAMRYVEGQDLKELLRGGPLEPERAVRICTQVAEALDFAHERGLVHRDVKPSNVLLDTKEHVYLADFGLTKRLGEGRSVEPGLFGTIDYVAPEQIRGDEIDGRADVYALGCLLYECLSGRAPLRRGSDAATLYAHLEEAPPRLPGLEVVLPKALSKEPDDRHQTCAELIDDVREALGIAQPRRSLWPIAVAAVGLAVVAAALLAFFLTRGGGGGPTTSGRLARIDPATNRVEQTIAVGNGPSAVAVDGSGVWVANHDDGTVWRIDPSGKSAPLKVPAHGKPADVSLWNGDAYVSNGPQDASIALLATGTGQTDDILNLSTGLGSLASARVAVGPLGLWVATPDRRVGRIVSGERVVSNATLPQPRDERADVFLSGMAVGGDSIWVVGDPNEPNLWRIDGRTGRLAQTIRLPWAPRDVAVGAGAVWVTSQFADRLLRIDSGSGRITANVPTGRGTTGVAVGAGSVWVANALDRTVSRIDPRTLRLVGTIPLADAPNDLAIGKGSVWVTAQAYPPSDAGSHDLKIGIFAACEETTASLTAGRWPAPSCR